MLEQFSCFNSNKLVVIYQSLLSANSGKPIVATNHRTGFQQKSVGKLSAMNVAFRYQSLQQAPYDYE
jgi:hypothetical protein